MGWALEAGRLGFRRLGRLAWLQGFFSLSLMNKKQNREKKEKKERLGEEKAQGDIFPGLTKMSLIQEK